MKLVLDTNVFVSAFGWGGNPYTVVRRIIEGLDTLFITDEVVEEVERVIKKPTIHVSKEKKEAAVITIKKYGKRVVIRPNQTVNISRDKTDNKFIDCALAANADYIVSGDIHLLELKEYGGVKIVSPKEYLEITTP